MSSVVVSLLSCIAWVVVSSVEIVVSLAEAADACAVAAAACAAAWTNRSILAEIVVASSTTCAL